MREFVVGANDTNVKAFHILEQASVLTIHHAHSDNIKRVRYAQEHIVLSASADKTVKLWDLRNSSEPLDTVRLPQPVEDFCQLHDLREYVVANGAMLNVIKLTEDLRFEKLAEYKAF